MHNADQIRRVFLQITLQTMLSRCGETLFTPLEDGQGVIMSIAECRLFNLNVVGRRVWELLETPKTLAELCAVIGGEFRVDPATCEAEVAKFVNGVANNGIIRVH